MSATSHASSLTRKSTGLTDVHTQLIRLLAEIAVSNYLAEVESRMDLANEQGG